MTINIIDDYIEPGNEVTISVMGKSKLVNDYSNVSKFTLGSTAKVDLNSSRLTESYLKPISFGDVFRKETLGKFQDLISNGLSGFDPVQIDLNQPIHQEINDLIQSLGLNSPYRNEILCEKAIAQLVEEIDVNDAETLEIAIRTHLFYTLRDTLKKRVGENKFDLSEQEEALHRIATNNNRYRFTHVEDISSYVFELDSNTATGFKTNGIGFNILNKWSKDAEALKLDFSCKTYEAFVQDRLKSLGMDASDPSYQKIETRLRYFLSTSLMLKFIQHFQAQYEKLGCVDHQHLLEACDALERLYPNKSDVKNTIFQGIFGLVGSTKPIAFEVKRIALENAKKEALKATEPTGLRWAWDTQAAKDARAVEQRMINELYQKKIAFLGWAYDVLNAKPN